MERIEHPAKIESANQMAILTIEELASQLQPNQAIAGLDLGTKTIGISVSDLGRRIATPREVIRRVKFGIDAVTLLAVAEKERVAALIIGLPVNMDGSEGPARVRRPALSCATWSRRRPCPSSTGMSGFRPSRPNGC